MEAFLPLLLIFAVMMLPMFWISSRQRKMQRQQQELVSQLGVGDEVRTHSGFYGLIVDEYDDVVVLETENGAQLKWDRRAIAGKVELPLAGTGTDGTLEDTDRDSLLHEDSTREDLSSTSSSPEFGTSYDDADRREDTLGSTDGDWRDRESRDR